MSTFYSTFVRRLEMLNFLRAQALPVSTERITQHLLNGGYLDESLLEKSLLRTVQRDLKELLGYEDEDGEYSNEFGLVMTRGTGKSLMWMLDPYDQRMFDFEKMPAFMALAFSVSQKHLSQVLPSNTRTELNRLFSEAESKLDKSDSVAGQGQAQYKRLKDSVEFFQRGQSLQPPNFDMNNLDTIYRAILLGRRVGFAYRTKNGIKEYDVHPFGVAIMLPKIYLVGVKQSDMSGLAKLTKHRDKDFRSFLVHKIENAFVQNQSSKVPKSFNMQQYLLEGNMDVLLDGRDMKNYKLRLEIYSEAGSNLLADLQESPVGKDQRLKKLSPDCHELTATVRRTVQLRNWLLSLGPSCRVLGPKVIVEDIRSHLEGMLERYSTGRVKSY